MIIGINGKAQSGKDTAAIIIKMLHPEFEIRRFSDKIKDIVCILTGCDKKQLEDQDFKESNALYSFSYRKLMQLVGTECARNMINQNIWIDSLFKDYKDEPLIIPDVRFLNEANEIRRRGGKLIHIIRDNDIHDQHISETDIPFFWDHNITNNGSIKELSKKILSCL